MPFILDIQPDDLKSLTPTQIRELALKLSQASLRQDKKPPSCANAGGEETANDDGIDVIVDDCNLWENLNSFIPKNYTIIQVKKTKDKISPANIKKEMAHKDKLFADIDQRNGAYILLNQENNYTQKTRIDRLKVMEKCLKDFPDIAPIFYDSSRLCDFINSFPDVLIWVKEMLGIPYEGWQSIKTLQCNTKFLSNDEKIIQNLENKQKFSLSDAKQHILQQCSASKFLRLIGVSGTGKTRFIQEVFKGNSLPVIYHHSRSKNSNSLKMIEYLLIKHPQEKISFVLDDCPSDVHSDCVKALSNDTKPNNFSLITIEHNAELNIPENTETFRLSYPNYEIGKKFLQQINPSLLEDALNRLLNLTANNFRLGELLAPTITENENITYLTNKKLVKRIFDQNGSHDKELWENALILSLFYSIKIEGELSELFLFENLFSSVTEETLYKSASRLLKKNIAQTQGENWWAMQPQILANHLTKIALEEILPRRLEKFTQNIISFSKTSPTSSTGSLVRPGKPIMSLAHRLNSFNEQRQAQKLASQILETEDLFTPLNNWGENLYLLRTLQSLACFNPNLALQRLREVIHPENPFSNFDLILDISFGNLIASFCKKGANLLSCLDFLLAIPLKNDNLVWKNALLKSLTRCLLTCPNKEKIKELLVKLYEDQKLQPELLASLLTEWINPIPREESLFSLTERFSLSLEIIEQLNNPTLHRFLFGNPPYYYAVIQGISKELESLTLLENFLEQHYAIKGWPEVWFLLQICIKNLPKESVNQEILFILNKISELIEPKSWDDKLTYLFLLPWQQRSSEHLLILTNTSHLNVERYLQFEKLPQETMDAMIKIGKDLAKEEIANLKFFDTKLLSLPPERLEQNQPISFIGMGLSLAALEDENLFKQIFEKIAKQFPYHSLGDTLLKTFIGRILEENPPWLLPYLNSKQKLNDYNFPLQVSFDLLIKIVKNKTDLHLLTKQICYTVFEQLLSNEKNTKEQLQLLPIFWCHSLTFHAKITAPFLPSDYKTLLELIWCTEIGGQSVFKILQCWTFQQNLSETEEANLANLIEYFLDLLGDSILPEVQSTCQSLIHQPQFYEIIGQPLLYLKKHSHFNKNLCEKLLKWLVHHLKTIDYVQNITGVPLSAFCPLIDYFYSRYPLETLETLLIPLPNPKDTYCLRPISSLSDVQIQIFSKIFKRADLIKWATKNKNERFPLLFKYIPIFSYTGHKHEIHPQFLPLLHELSEQQRKYFLSGDIKEEIEPHTYSGGFFQWNSTRQQNLDTGKVRALEVRKNLLETQLSEFQNSPIIREWKIKVLECINKMIENDCWVYTPYKQAPPPHTKIFET